MNSIESSIKDTKAQELIIDGAGCASCVGKIETALKNVNGVDNAQMNFALRTVVVDGEVDSEDLVQAIESIGYNARSAEDTSDDELLDEKEIADQKYYTSLMRQMWIALGLGVPLMIYSIAGGPMTVETTVERGIWLFIGILCAAIMYFAGKHFYVGAWKSFVNHSANMDTLIALGTGTAWIYSMVVVFFPMAVPE